jgi:hypothetical protein
MYGDYALRGIDYAKGKKKKPPSTTNGTHAKVRSTSKGAGFSQTIAGKEVKVSVPVTRRKARRNAKTK